AVILRGRENVRKWAEKVATTQARLSYIYKRQTETSKTGGEEFEGKTVIYSAPLPWGGTGISFQLFGVYSVREDRRRRYMAPGAIFLQYGEDGKIRRMRLLLAEISEVNPL